MSPKAILVFCAQALFVQSALSQCTSRAAVIADPGLVGPTALAGPYGLSGPIGLAGPGYFGSALSAPYGSIASGLAAPYGLTAPCGYASPALDYTPTSGGGLPVNSASSIAPVGLSVASENYYQGILAAAGELPFVGTVGLEGVLPTSGAGAVNHACGNGRNAMISEGQAYAPDYAGAYAGPYAPAAAIAPAFSAAAIAPAFGAAAISPAAIYGAGLASPFGYGAGLARPCGCAR